MQAKKTLEELTREVTQFVDEREWRPFMNPKDLAISISLEANELLEHFQWKKESELDEYVQEKNKEAVADELADVFIYSLYFAELNGIDLAEATIRKMKKNRIKYPVETTKGRRAKEMPAS